MSDLIDRQAAIDAVSDCGICIQRIVDLPSAQPEKRTEERTETHECDYISRQAAIDALADYVHNIDKVYSTGMLSAEDCRDAAKSVLDELPSVQPQSEIVRCKDCKRRYVENKVWTCPFGLPGGPEFFCGYGAEMEVEHEHRKSNSNI